MIWHKVRELHPPPHAKYLVQRGGYVYTVTPCYGMHAPWWIVKTLKGEAQPEVLEGTDEWTELHWFSVVSKNKLTKSLESLEENIKRNGHLDELCVDDVLKLIRLCKAAKALREKTKAAACGTTESWLTVTDEFDAAVEAL